MSGDIIDLELAREAARQESGVPISGGERLRPRCFRRVWFFAGFCTGMIAALLATIAILVAEVLYHA